MISWESIDLCYLFPYLKTTKLDNLKDLIWAFQVVLVVKNLIANAGDIRDMGSIPGLGRFPVGGHGDPP